MHETEEGLIKFAWRALANCPRGVAPSAQFNALRAYVGHVIVERAMRRLETVERLDAEDSHVRSGHVVLSVNYIRLDATLDAHNPFEM